MSVRLGGLLKKHPIWTAILLGAVGSLIAALIFEPFKLLLKALGTFIISIRIPDAITFSVALIALVLVLLLRKGKAYHRSNIRLTYPNESLMILKALANRPDKKLDKGSIISLFSKHTPALQIADIQGILAELQSENLVDSYTPFNSYDDREFWIIMDKGLQYLMKQTPRKIDKAK
jgi:hypothetical protein